MPFKARSKPNSGFTPPDNNNLHPVYQMLNDVLGERFGNRVSVTQVPGIGPNAQPTAEIRMLRQSRNGEYWTDPLRFTAKFAGASPVGWQGNPLGNLAYHVALPNTREFIQGATGKAYVDQQTGRVETPLWSPVESLANAVGFAFGAKESDTGTPAQRFELAMTHPASDFNVLGSAMTINSDQERTRAFGLFSQRVHIGLDYQRGVPGAFGVGQQLQDALRNAVLNPYGQWASMQNYMVYQRRGDIFGLRPAGDIVQEGSPGNPALISVLRGEGKNFGIKTSSSSGTRPNLTPIINQIGTNGEWNYQPMVPSVIQQSMGIGGQNATFNPLLITQQARYARLNAYLGGEEPGVPQQRLTSLSMIAPTTFPGAAIINQNAYNDIYGFGYAKSFRIPLESMPLENFLNDEGGLRLFDNLRPGAYFQAGRGVNRKIGSLGFDQNGDERFIRLGLKTSDYLVNNDAGAISLMVPSQYSERDYGGRRIGESTSDLVASLQLRYPNINVYSNPEITSPRLRIQGRYITGAGGKGEGELKFGFAYGGIPDMAVGNTRFTPTLVTGESKSLPITLMTSFALQPYQNQIDMLNMLSPQLGQATMGTYPYSPGDKPPVMDITDIAKEYTQIQRSSGAIGANVNITPLNMFSELLGKFINASDQANEANIAKYGIGRTGQQWISQKVSPDTAKMYQGIIREELGKMYPGKTEDEYSALASQNFQFRNLSSGMVQMRQMTSGMVMPTILPTSEEWLGGFIGNYEVMASTQELYPEFSRAMGLNLERGPLAKGVSRSTRSWAEAYKLESYRQDLNYGIMVQPPNSATVTAEQAKLFSDRYKAEISEDLNDEQLLEKTQSILHDVVPEARTLGSLYFPSINEAIISPETFKGITSSRWGEDVTKLTGTYSRALRNLASAEWGGMSVDDLRNSSYSAFNMSMTRTLGSRRSRGALRRIYGRENDMAFSARYSPLPGLGMNEMYVPNQVLRQLGIDPRELEHQRRAAIANGEDFTIPAVAGRYPTLSRGGGVVGMKLVTEAELLSRKNAPLSPTGVVSPDDIKSIKSIQRSQPLISIPRVPTGNRKGDPFARGIVYTNEAFSRAQHGDWDLDLLFSMLGLKQTTREIEYTDKQGNVKTRQKRTWVPVQTGDVMGSLSMSPEDRAKRYEEMMSVMGEHTEKLDVLRGAIRSMLEDPFAEAVKTSRLTGDNVMSPVDMASIWEAAMTVNVSSPSGKGRSYNARRLLEAVMTGEGGRTAEEISGVYDTSAYSFQQYLDNLRKSKEGFTPIEEAIGTVTINKAGKLSSIQGSGKEIPFSGITSSGQYDLGALGYSAGMDPSLSNEYLAYYFGQGKEGAESLLSKMSGHYMLKDGKPNESELEWRAKLLQHEASWGNDIGGKSPIASALTLSAIERARRSKTKWPEVQSAQIPWQGELLPVSDIVNDPTYINMRTGFQILTRQKGYGALVPGARQSTVPSASSIASLAQSGDLPLNLMARGIANNVLNVDEASETLNIMRQAQELTNPLMVAQVRSNFESGQIRVHASELYKAANGGNVEGNKALLQIIGRTAFNRDLLVSDSELFERGNMAEEAINSIKDRAVRNAMGIHIGQRVEQSPLTWTEGRVTVEGNPDWFALRREKDRSWTPIFTEAKSVSDEMYDAIKAVATGGTTGNPEVDDRARQKITELRAQPQSYERAYDEAQERFNEARIAHKSNPTPENEARLNSARDHLTRISNFLVPAHAGQKNEPNESIRATWRREILGGGTNAAISQMAITSHESSREAFFLSPEQLAPFNSPIDQLARDVQGSISTPEVVSGGLATISSLPSSTPGSAGNHTNQPFGITSNVPVAENLRLRNIALQSAEAISGGLPINVPMPPPQRPVNQVPTDGNPPPIPPVSGTTAAGAPPIPPVPPGGVPPVPPPPPPGNNIPPTPANPSPMGGFPRMSREDAIASVNRAVGQLMHVNKDHALNKLSSGVTNVVNQLLGRSDLNQEITLDDFYSVAEKDLPAFVRALGPETAQNLKGAMSASRSVRAAFNAIESAHLGNDVPGVSLLKTRVNDSSRVGRTLNRLGQMGAIISPDNPVGVPQNLATQAVRSAWQSNNTQWVVSQLQEIGVDITDPNALANLTQEQTAGMAHIMNLAPRAMGGVKALAGTLKEAGVPREMSIGMQNLNQFMKEHKEVRTLRPEEEMEQTPGMKKALGDWTKTIENLNSKMKELTSATDDQRKSIKAQVDQLEKEERRGSANYRVEEVQGILSQIQQMPPSPERTKAWSEASRELRQASNAYDEATKESTPVSAAGKISRFGRELMGGWGMFYMGHLMGLGRGLWDQGYNDVNQYYQQTQQSGMQMLGGISGYQNPEYMYRAALLRGGGAMGANLRRMESQLPMGLIGDLGGIGLTGVGAGLLTSYVGNAAIGAGLVSEATVGTAIPAVGLAVGLGAAAVNQYAIATNPMTPALQAGRSVRAGDYGDQWNIVGSLGQTAEWAWNSISQSPSSRVKEQGFASAIYGYRAGLNWDRIRKNVGGTNQGLLQLAQTMAITNPEMEGISPEAGVNAYLWQMAAGVYGKNVGSQAATLATAMQSGIDLQGPSSAFLQVTQGGAVTPISTYNPALYFAQAGAQKTAEFQAGSKFLSQVPYSSNILRGYQSSSADIHESFAIATGTGLSPEQARQLQAIQKFQQLENKPLQGEAIQAFGNWSLAQNYGLNFGAMPQISTYSGVNFTPQQRVQWERQSAMQNMSLSANSNLLASTSLSQPMISSLVSGAYNQGDYRSQWNSLNMLTQVSNRDPYAIAMASYATGTYNANPSLISVDLNKQGVATGQSLYATNMFAFQASQVWGANWQSGLGSGMRQAAVNGIQAPWGKTLYGMQAMELSQLQTSYGYTQQALGIQGAQLALHGEYMPKFWNVEDRQRYLGYAQQYWQFDYQQRQLNLQSRQFSENQSLERREFGVNRAFTQNQWEYQTQMRELNWQWKQEDFQEEARFMTGRQRRLAERQLKRDTISYNLEGNQIQQERDHQKELWKLTEDRFNLEKKHFDENKQMQQEALNKDKEFFEQRKALEEESIKLNREYQTKQLELSKASLALQIEQAAVVHQQQLDMMALKQSQDDITGQYRIASQFEHDFADSTLKALEASQKIFDLWDQLLKDATGQNYAGNTSDSGSGDIGAQEKAYGVDLNGNGVIGRSLGGHVSKGRPYEVEESGREIFIPEGSGTIVPMSKLQNPWDYYISKSGESSESPSGGNVAKVSIYIGDEHFKTVIVNTVNKEIRL